MSSATDCSRWSIVWTELWIYVVEKNIEVCGAGHETHHQKSNNTGKEIESCWMESVNCCVKYGALERFFVNNL